MPANTLQVSGLSYHQLPETVKRDLFNAFIKEISRLIRQKSLADFFIEQLMLRSRLAHDTPESIGKIHSLDTPAPHTVLEPAHSKYLADMMKIFHHYLDEINKITDQLDALGINIKETADTIVNLLAKAAHVPAVSVEPTVYSTLRHMAAHIAHGLGFPPHVVAAAATTAPAPAATLAATATTTLMTPAASIPAPSAPPAPLSAALPVFTAVTASKEDPEKKEEAPAPEATTEANKPVVSTPTLTPAAGKKEKKTFLDYFTRTYSSLFQRLFSLNRRPSGLNESLRTFSLDIIDQVRLFQRLDECLQSTEQFLHSFSASYNRHANTAPLSYTIGSLLAQQGFFPEPESQISIEIPRPYWIIPSRGRGQNS